MSLAESHGYLSEHRMHDAVVAVAVAAAADADAVGGGVYHCLIETRIVSDVAQWYGSTCAAHAYRAQGDKSGCCV